MVRWIQRMMSFLLKINITAVGIPNLPVCWAPSAARNRNRIKGVPFFLKNAD